MSWIAAATIGSTLISGLIQSDATGDAADSQAAGTAAGIAEQRRQFDLTRSDFAPYRETGASALKSLYGDINTPTTQADVMSDPGYQFGLEQGQQAIDRKIAAGGGRVSGAAIKAAGRFGTNFATSGYNAAYQRRQDRMNRLAAIAGIGQTSTSSSAQAGQGTANAISGLLTQQGDNAGAAQLARGTIWGDSANQIAALYGRSRRGTTGGTDLSSFRYDDPYRNPGYFGGGEGE